MIPDRLFLSPPFASKRALVVGRCLRNEGGGGHGAAPEQPEPDGATLLGAGGTPGAAGCALPVLVPAGDAA